jgi:peptidylprolyl isomerase
VQQRARALNPSAVLARSAVAVLAGALALAGCSGGSGSSSSASSSAGKAGKSGVTATGKFGEKPTVTVPKADPPKTTIAEVLSPGTGPKVAAGQVLVANYLGQTWDLKDGKPNVFDNSYDRKTPLGFPVGAGQVIKGWDTGLVGQNLGSRVLLSIPADQAYGATADGQNQLSGHALVFVVDLVDALDKNVAAKGTKVTTPLPAGLPALTADEPGAKPVLALVSGLKPGTAPLSAMLLTGTGDAIDTTKSLALQIVQTDSATGKQFRETWGTAPQLVPAKDVLSIFPVLTGQKVGSRAISLTPKTAQNPSLVVVVDVVAQY